MSALKTLDWDKARKAYPEIIQSIHDWFCEMIGGKTKIWFYNQPCWRIEVMPVYLKKVHGLKIVYDVSWVAKAQQFKFVYAIIDGEKAVPPQEIFSERIQAELFAYAHVLQYIKDKAAQVETAEIDSENKPVE